MNKKALTEADIRTKFITPALVGVDGADYGFTRSHLSLTHIAEYASLSSFWKKNRGAKDNLE